MMLAQTVTMTQDTPIVQLLIAFGFVGMMIAFTFLIILYIVWQEYRQWDIRDWMLTFTAVIPGQAARHSNFPLKGKFDKVRKKAHIIAEAERKKVEQRVGQNAATMLVRLESKNEYESRQREAKLIEQRAQGAVYNRDNRGHQPRNQFLGF